MICCPKAFACAVLLQPSAMVQHLRLAANPLLQYGRPQVWPWQQMPQRCCVAVRSEALLDVCCAVGLASSLGALAVGLGQAAEQLLQG